MGAAIVASLFLNAYFAAGSKGIFYNAEFAPAVLWTCGHGFRNVPTSVPGGEPLYAFLSHGRQTFECRQLPTEMTTHPLTLFQATHRYLMMLSGAVWRVGGISWAVLAWIGVAFSAVAAAGCYLFMRCAMGRVLAVLLTGVWVLSPLHLAQLPHLRDYAKAPFFMLTLSGVGWIVLTKPARSTTVLGAAVMGSVLGIGFGMRTDVIVYVLILLVALLLFRPHLDRHDAGIRLLALGAAVFSFVVTSWPILRGYQGGDNVAHVATLGLTDASRQMLKLWDAPYSYGHMYDDHYVEAVINGYIERRVDLAAPVEIGTAEYAAWGNVYYRGLLREFFADALIRAWASVIGVFDFPFRAEHVQRLPWLPLSVDRVFTVRARMLEAFALIPPYLMPAIVVAGLAAYSLRVAAVALFFATIIPGLTAVQFHSRHFFHLEPLPLFAYGAALAAVWRIWRARMLWPEDGLRPAVVRVTALTMVVAIGIVGPVSAARRAQERSVLQLLGSYETAPTIPVNASPLLVAPGLVRFPVALPVSAAPARFVDSNVVTVAVGGPDCDLERLPLTFRYEVVAPLVDFSRDVVAEVPSTGASTLVVSPVYTPGRKSTIGEARQFAGVEVPAEHQRCIRSIGRFAHPESFPILLDATLPPDWRSRRLFETLRDFEAVPDYERANDYFIPPGLPPGRQWLARLESLGPNPSFRSRQVTRAAADTIEIDGRAETIASYILMWPDQPRIAGSTLLVSGELFEGRLTIGVQRNQEWVKSLNVDEPGRFRALIQVDADGEYAVVLADDVVTERRTRVVLTQFGWLPPRS